MKQNHRPVPTKFGPETRFEVRLSASALLRAREDADLERLKARLLAEGLKEHWEAPSEGPLRQAADEAAALAWATQYPLLVFPVLFEERAQAALLRADRQEHIRERTRELLAV